MKRFLLALAMLTTVLRAEPTSSRVALLTIDQKALLVQSYQALYPGKVQVFDLAQGWPAVGALEKFNVVVLHAPAADKLPALPDPNYIQDLGRSRKNIITGLEEFARLYELKVTEQSVANANHLPPLSNEQKDALVKAASKVCNNTGPEWQPIAGNLAESWMNEIVSQIRAEVLEEIPRMVLAGEAPLTRGFSLGDALPWCGNRDGKYLQRQLEGALPERAQVLAVSSLNQKPLMVALPLYTQKQPVQRYFYLYALDFNSLDEPEVTWETRGSFNKYLFAGNVINTAVSMGRYWNQKPLAEEWPGILAGIAERHPALRVETEGWLGGYTIQSLNLGEPGKPIWYAMGMYHAEDEWRSALGIVDFIIYLAEHRFEPEIAQLLAKYQVKVIPCTTPTMYMKALRGSAPGPDPKPQPDPAKKEPANLASIFTIHEHDGHQQYQMIAMSAGAIEFIPGMESILRQRMRDRFVEWPDGRAAGPVQAQANSNRGGMEPADAEKSRYYGFVYGLNFLYNLNKPSYDKVPIIYCLESGRRGFLPETLLSNYQLRGLVWQEDLYRSAVINESVAQWVLAAFLASPK